jgi:two-component system, OmpR family, response regulator CpxR
MDASRAAQTGQPLHAGTLLLVDDDAELCALMTDYLGARGYAIASAYDGVTGLKSALEQPFDLIILDVMLPQLGGFDVLRQLRRRSQVPVLMLTARVDERDRIEGLEAGADDYLVKPFGVGELLARIRAILRRASAKPVRTGPIDIGQVRLHPDTREVWCDDARVALTSLEFSLLELLMQSAGRIVSREEISAALYQRALNPYDRSLDVHMSNLRKKLEGDRATHREPVIRTIRGVGYLFVVPA